MENSQSYESEERLQRVYDEGRQLFLQGNYVESVERFSGIYRVDLFYRDVVEIVHEFYEKPRSEWIAKYTPRFEIGAN